MLNHILKSRPARPGTTIERVWTYELTSMIAFGRRRRSAYRRLTAASEGRPGDRVLDIGCNGGYLARLPAAAVAPGGQVAGVDPCPPAIAYAIRRAPANATFTVGVAQALPWPSGRLLVADFRPSRWHRGPHGMRHAQAVDLRPLVEAAGLRVKAGGGVPMMSYIYAVR